MDELQRNEHRPVNPRRRQRSQLQIFKEAYLPAMIAGLALLLIIIFIIGSITRGIQRNKLEAQASLDASISDAMELAQLTAEASKITQQAAELASHFDYDGALSVIDTFSGDISRFPVLAQMREQYICEKENLVPWSDPNQVINLSFQLLIADPNRAFRDQTYGTSYNKNFVTIEEFSQILQQLYTNNYILIRMSDIVDSNGVKELYLPSGKKPLILTQTQVNYYTYMTDGDGDKLPDKDGAGFASRLILDANSHLTCEMVDANGQTVTGAYDLVPILDAFIQTHPDFSYKGAKAILAVTGYDGLFGYRTNAQVKTTFGQAYYDSQCEAVTKIIKKLRETGYEIGCYTYGNVAYGSYSAAQIQSDLQKWSQEVTPILGAVDTLIFARNSDITSGSAAYSGEKYAALQSFGFTQYLGFSSDGKPWFTANENYVRQGRIMVSGSNMAYHADWFTGIFDAASILDSSRKTIPT